jgi:hypothetical protein
VRAALGVATPAGGNTGGLALWALCVQGAELPGLFVSVDGRFIPNGEETPLFPAIFRIPHRFRDTLNSPDMIQLLKLAHTVDARNSELRSSLITQRHDITTLRASL